jgi:hypothetical protein
VNDRNDDVVGTAYADAIRDLVSAERTRKSSLEERGVRVITTSGALAALVFAIAKFGVGTDKQLELPNESYTVAALVCFGIAALLGVLTNQPADYPEVEIVELHKRVSHKEWMEPTSLEGHRIVAESRVWWLQYARRSNAVKAIFLFLAISFQVLAVVCLTAAVALLLTDHPNRLPWIALTGALTAGAALYVLRFRVAPTLSENWSALRRGPKG